MSPDGLTPPSVSVLIAVHNGLPYVESAVRSIMEQSLRDIEIVIVDDASTDETPAVLARLAAEDPRIRIETLAQNRRLPGALNRGLELVRGAYVARMDADDLAYPDRLAVQKTYLDRHPDVALLASGMDQIDPDGNFLRASPRPRDDFAARWLARFHMPLVHPSFMFRNPAPDGTFLRYEAQWTVTEDYDFTARALQSGDVVSLSDRLLRYRVHGNSITGKNWNRQLTEAGHIARRVQAETLPPEVCTALQDLNAAFLDRKPASMGGIFAGLDAMIAHDRQSVGMSARRLRWMRRQAAQLALRALQRSGRGGKTSILRGFAGPGLRYLPSLMMRAAEIKGVLPSSLRSNPKI